MTVVGGDQQDVEVRTSAQRAVVGLATTDIQLIVEASGVGPPGPPGPEGPPGGTIVSGHWDYSTATSPPPGVGQCRTTPAVPVVDQPYTVYLSSVDRDGFVWSGGSIRVGDEIMIRGTAGAVQMCLITDVMITSTGTPYATIQTTLTESTGAVAKNADVRIDLIRQMGEATSLVLTSPLGKKYRVTVNEAGVLTTAAV